MRIKPRSKPARAMIWHEHAYARERTAILRYVSLRQAGARTLERKCADVEQAALLVCGNSFRAV